MHTVKQVIIDVSFKILARDFPLDHGYAVYSSLSRKLPIFHQATWLGIHRVGGLQLDGKILRLTSNSRLTLRLPAENVPHVLPLSGSKLTLFANGKEYPFRLGVPEIFALRPATDLFSSCVVIKVSGVESKGLAPDRETYLAAIRKKLADHEIAGEVWIDDEVNANGREHSRRVIRIKGRSVIGYAVTVSNLSDADSIKLQSLPIFGRRRFGCGIFVPFAPTGSGLSTPQKPVQQKKKADGDFQFLLAKSYPGSSSDFEPPPAYARLLPHLRAVERAGESIVDAVGEILLQQLDLGRDPWLSRLRRALRVACLCHDLGKANDGFQKMIRGLLDPRQQPARHELLSALILMDKGSPIRRWALEQLKQNDDEAEAKALLDCVIGAVSGHHVKLDPNWKKAALALRGGCGRSLKAILNHADLKPLFNDVTGPAVSFSLVDGEPNYLGRHYLPFSMSSNSWRNSLKKEGDWWRFAAALKALVTAADVAGSAMLPEKGRVVISDWIQATLKNQVTQDLMQEVVDARLKGNEPRKFQKVIAATSSRVTLVEAGCGSGKTAAAYMWACHHAHGKKLFFCYPTTGTASEGFLGYVNETNVEASLIHSRSIVDLEGVARVVDDDKDDHLLRIESLNAWGPQAIICTADTVLALVRNNRRGLYNSPAILSGAFVFDELHAYDDRMFEALIALIKALPGAHFLLMTASLPKARKSFLSANIEIHEVPPEKDFEEIPRYHFQAPMLEDDAYARVVQAFHEGKRVLWICNTVRKAQRVLDKLETLGIAACTYHSRFKYEDRVHQHRKVVQGFSAEKRSAGIVAVTTQVAEMSLDLDADVLITEIAPIPALIQRLGRLNRRVTPENAGEPRPAFFYMPAKAAPYDPIQLQLAEQWIDVLRGLGRPLSQSDLSERFNELSSSEELHLDTRTAWLDSGWFATPEQVRDLSPSVSVILAEDETRCRENHIEIIRRAIPMTYNSKMAGWPEFKGNLIAQPGTISYDSQKGAILL